MSSSLLSVSESSHIGSVLASDDLRAFLLPCTIWTIWLINVPTRPLSIPSRPDGEKINSSDESKTITILPKDRFVEDITDGNVELLVSWFSIVALFLSCFCLVFVLCLSCLVLFLSCLVLSCLALV